MELLQIAKPPFNIDIFSPAVRVEVSRLTRSDRRNPPGKSAIALPYRQSLFAVCLSSGDFTGTFFMRYGYNYGISLLQPVQWDYFIHHAFYHAKPESLETMDKDSLALERYTVKRDMS